MSGRDCCGRAGGDFASPPAARTNLGRNCVRAGGWVVPGVVLALTPKCPMCLAAYVAVATGIAVPAATAASMRTALIGISIAALAASAFALLARRRAFRVTAPTRAPGGS